MCHADVDFIFKLGESSEGKKRGEVCPLQVCTPSLSLHPMLIILYRKYYSITSAMTTLHRHILREAATHCSTYHEMCEKNNIPLVILCPKEDGGGSVQSDLSSFVVKTTQVAPWCREGRLSHICKWIVLDNQVCTSLYIMLYILIYIYSVILCHREGVIQGATQLSVPVLHPS